MYGCMHLIWGDMCGNKIVNEINSPDKKCKVVIFTRDCGATTGFSTQVSVIESDDKLEKNDNGNILIMSDKTGDGLTFENGGAKVKARWDGNNDLRIYFDQRTETSKQRNRIEDIKISYEQIQN